MNIVENEKMPNFTAIIAFGEVALMGTILVTSYYAMIPIVQQAFATKLSNLNDIHSSTAGAIALHRGQPPPTTSEGPPPDKPISGSNKPAGPPPDKPISGSNKPAGPPPDKPISGSNKPAGPAPTIVADINIADNISKLVPFA